jgi:DNA-directed RNA polymerase specialized sigma24 family protein
MPTLRAYVHGVVRNRETEDDIVQEICLRAFAGEGPLDRDSFQVWTFGIARHVIASEWRNKRRTRAHAAPEGQLIEEIRDPLAGTDRRLNARASLARGLDNRNPIALLLHRYMAGTTQAGDEGGLSKAAGRMRLMRLRAAARSHEGDT